MGGLRPRGISRRALVLVALAGAFSVIARTTGSGWVVVLVCGVLGVLVAAAVLPACGLARVEVSARAPRDATVERAVPVRLGVRRGRGLRLWVVDPPGEWVAADAPADGEVLVRPARRGVFGEIAVEVASAAPLGLVWWRRRLRVGLPHPIEVGPRPVDVPLASAVPGTLTGAEARLRGRLGSESVRGVREYVAGDPIKLVHWPATARWGEPMVKELETSDAPRLAIVVDLRGDEDGAELAASRAAGLTRAGLRVSLAVFLLTAERSGPVVGEVTSAAEAGRRLARAVAGPPADGPIPAGTVVVRLTASDDGEEHPRTSNR